MDNFQNILNELRGFFKNNSALVNLIVINVAVFVLVNIINLFLWLFAIDSSSYISGAGRVTLWLSVPANIGALIVKPWTLFTYMFVQENFLHLLFNMIVLYFGGRIFSEFLDDKKLINTYIWGGLFGAFFFVLAYNIFPVFSSSVPLSVALGSSASVLAILIAIATYSPNYTVNLMFIGKMKLKYIAIFFVVLDVLSINRGNPGGHIAHLGGALWGYISITMLRRGYKNPLGINWYGIKGIFDWFRKKPEPKFKKVHRNERPVTDEEYNRRKAENQKVIDEILDKVARSGYDSLTKKEKEILFNASNKSN